MSRRCSAREDATGQPARRRAAVALAASLTICACAAGPPAGGPPIPSPISRLHVEGAAGATAPAAALRQVAAEGRATLARHHLQVTAGLDGGTLYRGNAAALLIDGPATFAAMKAAIAGARHRVLLESYIVEDQGVAAQIADLLLERAGAGVSVALLYDAIGSIGTPEAFFARLRAGGVAVCAFKRAVRARPRGFAAGDAAAPCATGPRRQVAGAAGQARRTLAVKGHAAATARQPAAWPPGSARCG